MNLLDTDVIIQMIKEKKYSPGIISPITLIEVLRGIETNKRPRVKQLLEESFPILNLDNSIIETYCSIYQRLKKERASLPDANLLVAATAMAHNLPLETRDDHFQRLKPMGLRLK
jgi:predicted nucleic acid-binding protein